MALSCTKCGSTSFTPEDAEQSKVVGGHVLTASLHVRRCDRCKMVRVDANAAGEHDREIIRKIALDGPVCGESFRILRTWLGMRAADVAYLLNVAGETVSRWERSERSTDFAPWFVVAQWALARLEGEEQGKLAIERVRRVRGTLPAKARGTR